MTRITAHRVRYKVQGSGPFPIDMLRFDVSAPDQSTDSDAIFHSITNLGTDGDITVTLTRYAETGWKPWADRWESFGWRVVAGSLERAS